MEASKRVEVAARAMARYRLGLDSFISGLNPDVIAKVRQRAEDKLWPSLVSEAKAMVEAIDAFERETNGPAIEQGRAGELPGEGQGQIFAPAPAVKPVDSTCIEESSSDQSANMRPEESHIEHDKAVPAVEQDGHTRVSWLDARKVAQATPKQEPSVDPATEALRSALAALATTGIPNRGKTGG